MKSFANRTRKSIVSPTGFWFLVILLVSHVNFSDYALAQSAPYPPSQVITDVTWDFDGAKAFVIESDLWPVTWAADDNVYTSWGDGNGFQFGDAALGFARIEGNPPFADEVSVQGMDLWSTPRSNKGKVAGMLAVAGTLYAWKNTQAGNPPGFRLMWSTDLGLSWQTSSWVFLSGEFAPDTFLNFGKDYVGARDDFVYFYGGSWGLSVNVYLVRAPKAQITERAAYEFFAGVDANGNPLWTSNMSERQPVFTDPNLSNEFNGGKKATVVYNPVVQRYLLTISHGGTDKLGLFDAPEPWGPWTTVAYYNSWSGCSGCSGEALYYNFANKWTSADGKTMWMVYSGTGNGFPDSFSIIKATLTLKPLAETRPRTFR